VTSIQRKNQNTNVNVNVKVVSIASPTSCGTCVSSKFHKESKQTKETAIVGKIEFSGRTKERSTITPVELLD